MNLDFILVITSSKFDHERYEKFDNNLAGCSMAVLQSLPHGKTGLSVYCFVTIGEKWKQGKL